MSEPLSNAPRNWKSRNIAFENGGGRPHITPEGWTRVRANTVAGHPENPPYVMVQHEDGTHSAGYVTEHTRDAQKRTFKLQRDTERSEVSVPHRRWIYVHTG